MRYLMTIGLVRCLMTSGLMPAWQTQVQGLNLNYFPLTSLCNFCGSFSQDSCICLFSHLTCLNIHVYNLGLLTPNIYTSKTPHTTGFHLKPIAIRLCWEHDKQLQNKNQVEDRNDIFSSDNKKTSD